MKTYIANDPNPPLRDETKHRVLQYFSLYNTYDTSWTTFLEQQNIKHMYDLKKDIQGRSARKSFMVSLIIDKRSFTCLKPSTAPNAWS